MTKTKTNEVRDKTNGQNRTRGRADAGATTDGPEFQGLDPGARRNGLDVVPPHVSLSQGGRTRWKNALSWDASSWGTGGVEGVRSDWLGSELFPHSQASRDKEAERNDL